MLKYQNIIVGIILLIFFLIGMNNYLDYKKVKECEEVYLKCGIKYLVYDTPLISECERMERECLNN